MIEFFQRIVASLMNGVRVNHVRPDSVDGAPVFVKRRRIGGTISIWFGNLFLSLADSGVCMFVKIDEWLDWETYCARLLYPERPAVRIGPGKELIVPKVCGMTLRQLLRSGDPDEKAFVLAARELKRVHQIECSRYQAAWSHGDLHLDNIVCDLDADRAVLIDFDTRHDRRLSDTRRHADDLQTLLLELIGLPREKWVPYAAVLLEEYGDELTLHELARHLFVPRGFARILWFTRTNCSFIRRIEPRLQLLRGIIHQVISKTEHYVEAQLHRDAP